MQLKHAGQNLPSTIVSEYWERMRTKLNHKISRMQFAIKNFSYFFLVLTKPYATEIDGAIYM